ncbi:YsnF/AvaK domain-containing protein [Micromonospora sp. DSM 115977]|uniref:YsnF/AvaK domain-containing protein n=1 Tax=Micromonospora reichwaldensis TaxID=3075516 RepID=A0ABU2WYI5_9ACTN|nr:YsnF/AvaK domain-containing protein [Micromonospora sp. DSM 115977]MDT0531000.1 YsnF/AvaK domain-containing protein [Micromonospora sp. DSM 115977]
MRLNEQQANSLYGQDVKDRSGSKIGSVGQIWADAAGEPTWVSVKTGLMGHKESMAPLEKARITDSGLAVDYDKSTVKDAPAVDAGTDQPLDTDQIEQLYAHYRLTPQAPRAPQPPPAAGQGRAPAAGEDLIRSEERLRVGTESQPAGAARLRKYVVTEDVHTTVPVEHDEVRVEREPIAARDARGMRADIGEAEQEMTLRAERPVVGKETVPVERVHLAKEEVVEEQPIDDQIRRERVDADIPERSRRRR